ncbi:MAG: hypothetical protein WKF90_05485 [Pyrinomonadaceae bacterium]
MLKAAVGRNNHAAFYQATPHPVKALTELRVVLLRKLANSDNAPYKFDLKGWQTHFSYAMSYK